MRRRCGGQMVRCATAFASGEWAEQAPRPTHQSTPPRVFHGLHQCRVVTVVTAHRHTITKVLSTQWISGCDSVLREYSSLCAIVSICSGRDRETQRLTVRAARATRQPTHKSVPSRIATSDTSTYDDAGGAGDNAHAHCKSRHVSAPPRGQRVSQRQRAPPRPCYMPCSAGRRRRPCRPDRRPRGRAGPRFPIRHPAIVP